MKFTETKKRPGGLRTDTVLQGMNLVQAYDGTSGWKIFPLYGRKDPEKMSADEARSMAERIQKEPRQFLRTLVSEELGLSEENFPNPWRSTLSAVLARNCT